MATPASCSGLSARQVCCLASLALLFAASALFSSCGGSGSGPGNSLHGNTAVTLMLTSTANDQLSQFEINLTSLTLTSQSGEPVTLVSTSQQLEFMHLNGRLESLLTVTVPQGIYTSATATVGANSFTCVALNQSGALDTSVFANAANHPPAVTIDLPSPITITGTAMGLSLNLIVSQSETYPSTCYVSGIEPYSLTPTFELTPVTFSSDSSVKELGLDGEITAISDGGATFSVQLGDGQTLSPTTSMSTVCQGIGGLASLSVGLLVDMDATVQSDGSLLATRIAVEDSNTENLSVMTGQLVFSSSAVPTLISFTQQDQGYLATNRLVAIDSYFSYGDTLFQVSGQYSNLQNLPFSTTLSSSTTFPGQNLYVSTHGTNPMAAPTYYPASTITLMPQTINGIVQGSSTDGSFTTYTVSLASYDPIATLAIQSGQTTVITSPTTVVVYVDSSTQMQNTAPLAVGSTLRFTGLLFDDGGTMRMDCGQVLDGVAE
jgi:Domain of unknown function (DUF5666)